VKREPTIIIDSREQCPLDFPTLTATTGTLDTGDYSICGLEHLIAVTEVHRRPTHLHRAGAGALQAEELQRLRAYRFRLLIIEASAAELESGVRGGTPWRSTLQPAHVVGSLAAWTAQYGLPVWLAGDRAGAGRFVERYLYQCARAVATEYESAAGFLALAEAVAASVEAA
jgi:hypothetical protein